MIKGLFTHMDTAPEAPFTTNDPADANDSPPSHIVARQHNDTAEETVSIPPDPMDAMSTWPPQEPVDAAPLGTLDLPSYDFGIPSWADSSPWTAMNTAPPSDLMHPLDASLIFNNWDGFSQNIAQEPDVQRQDQYSAAMTSSHHSAYMDNVLPPTPPTANSMQSQQPQHQPTAQRSYYCPVDRLTELAMAHEVTPPSSSRSNSTSSQDEYNALSPQRATCTSITLANKSRRRSAEQHLHHPGRAPVPRRRATSHPSVASVVSLTSHEPVAKMVDGVEYITFLYSHDRMVKEYTVCTDINSIAVEDIPIDFRLQNSIYPRANVERDEYDGNRWGYETSCNALGWQICWLNRDQLFGRRGLIQRAVDSYRNRHPEMRSRRVARQEKIANGTLRKRRAKRGSAAIF